MHTSRKRLHRTAAYVRTHSPSNMQAVMRGKMLSMALGLVAAAWSLWRAAFSFHSTKFDFPTVEITSRVIPALYPRVSERIDLDRPVPLWLGRTQRYLDHPHRGARHPNGTEGMIVNPSTLRLAEFDPFNITSTSRVIDRNVLCPSQSSGIEGVGGRKVLQRIRKGIKASIEFVKAQETAIHEQDRTIGEGAIPNLKETAENISIAGNAIARARKSRILCMIYTVHYPPDYNNLNLRAQANTWGRKCDGFIAASNYTDHSVGSIDLLHLGDEAYANMWQKTRSMFTYAYDHYRDDYDFFYIGGDDIYVAVDNLRAYVDGPEVLRLENGFVDRISAGVKDLTTKTRLPPEQLPPGANIYDPLKRPRPLFFGIPMMQMGKTFPSGGPGYTLNRAALDLFVEEGIPSFLPDSRDSREDVFIGSFFCLRGVYLSYTNDENDGARFWSSAELSSKYDGQNSVVDLPRLKFLFDVDIALGAESASSQQIGFHLKDDRQMLQRSGRTIAEQIYRYHALLHDWCEEEVK